MCDKGTTSKKCNPNKICSFKKNVCDLQHKYEKSSAILENVLDISTTLVKIMCICGIHECKANKALDIIIYAFMHFDEVAEHPGGKRKKRIRKEEFYTDLIRDCGLTKNEAKLTYSIVRCGFKAFYHKQDIRHYAPELIDECAWKNAAKQTISGYSKLGASKSDVQIAEKRISCAYDNFVSRLKVKIQEKNNPKGTNRNTCVCGKPDNTCDHHHHHHHHHQHDHHQHHHHENICNNNFQNDFNVIDPCEPTVSDPPLTGEFSCQLTYPPGSKRPQFICKDPCGRTFMKVDGTKVVFDPFLIELEIRRVAQYIQPSCDADRIRTLKESLNICQIQDYDSSDEKLAEICRDESISILSDDEDEVDVHDSRHKGEEDTKEDKKEARKEDKKEVTKEGKKEDRREDKKEGRKEHVEEDGKKHVEEDRKKHVEEDRKKHSTEDEMESRKEHIEEEGKKDDFIEDDFQVGMIDPLKDDFFSEGMKMSINAEFKDTTDGLLLEISMKGSFSSPPKDTSLVKILCNQQAPHEFTCKAIEPGTKGTTLSSQEQGTQPAPPESTAISVNIETVNNRSVMDINMEGFCDNFSHLIKDIKLLRIYCNDDHVEFELSPKATTEEQVQDANS